MGAHSAVQPGLSLSGQRTALGMMAAGAGVATMTMTGTFPAISTDLADDPVATVEQSVPAPATVAPRALPAAPRHAAPVSVADTQPLVALPASASFFDSPVAAEDMHSSDARQIAALSKAVNLHEAEMAREAAAAKVEAQRRSTIASLTLPASIGGISLSGLAASHAGVSALKAAATKIGRPYIWGAAGPSAFDCSGLVQWAYKQIGISLPRTSRAQSNVGVPVSRDELRPGDLVFFYSPVSHVGIYLGHNKILNAEQSGQPVKVSDISHMPFHNARRIT
jgi:cell wall-associated NlpC family hydrolase